MVQMVVIIKIEINFISAISSKAQAHYFLSIGPLADAFNKSICPYVCLCVCQSVCLFTFEVPFKRLIAPISLNRMSKIFRDLESLGKSNGKSGLR